MLRRGLGRRGRPGLIGMAARTAVVAGTATAVSGAVQDHRANKAQAEQEAAAAEQQQAAPEPVYAPPPPAAVPPPAASTNDLLDQLTRLGQLKADGVLTEAEFTAQKARILG